MLTTKDATRFWSRVQITEGDGCWLWIGGKVEGYGRMWLQGKLQLAHVIAFEEEYNPVPPGLCVLHSCDNPPCVRPDHLWLGTLLDNWNDMRAKGRNPKGSQYCNAKLTEEDVTNIRLLRSEGISAMEIAKWYGMSRSRIAFVIRGIGWKHVPDQADFALSTKAKGSNVATSKLNESDIPMIRNLHSQGESYSALGRIYGVWPSTIQSIVQRKTWNHIA